MRTRASVGPRCIRLSKAKLEDKRHGISVELDLKLFIIRNAFYIKVLSHEFLRKLTGLTHYTLHLHTYMYRYKNRQTDRQVDRKTDRQVYRRTNRQTYTFRVFCQFFNLGAVVFFVKCLPSILQIIILSIFKVTNQQIRSNIMTEAYFWLFPWALQTYLSYNLSHS